MVILDLIKWYNFILSIRIFGVDFLKYEKF